MPNLPQGPIKLGKNSKILESLELHLLKKVEVGVKAHKCIKIKSKSP